MRARNVLVGFPFSHIMTCSTLNRKWRKRCKNSPPLPNWNKRFHVQRYLLGLRGGRETVLGFYLKSLSPRLPSNTATCSIKTALSSRVETNLVFFLMPILTVV